MSDNIYVPGSSAKFKDTSFGVVAKISFKAEALKAFIDEHVNEKGYINLDIVPRREVGTYGDTHSVKLDTWKPAEQQPANEGKRPVAPANKTAAAKPKDKPAAPAPEDDIPF